MPTTSGETVALNWTTTDINQVDSLGPVSWEALIQYAIDIKLRCDGNSIQITCQLSSDYSLAARTFYPAATFDCIGPWVKG